MNTLVALVAQGGLYLVAGGAVVAWLVTRRDRRLSLALSAVLAMILVVVCVKVAGSLWTDPRPFVVDGRPPLIPHGADNGFPSDHTTLAAAVAGVVVAEKRLLGIALLALATALGAARVAGHVHHIPDVALGLVLGLVCATAAVFLSRKGIALARRPRAGPPPSARAEEVRST